MKIMKGREISSGGPKVRWSATALVTALLLALEPAIARAVVSPCSSARADEAKLVLSDLPFGLSWQQTLQLADAIYSSGKRLAMRAYWSAEKNSHVLPFKQDSEIIEVPISERFIGSVRTHIEKGLERRYAQAVFMSDMGHSHFLIPNDKYQAIYKEKSRSEVYQSIFDDPDVRILYHTAERMKFDDSDPHMGWRKNTRNLVGENRPGGDVFVAPGYDDKSHTLREMDGYTWFSAGFNISASKDGCFPFLDHGRSLNFDLSLYDVQDSSADREFVGF